MKAKINGKIYPIKSIDFGKKEIKVQTGKLTEWFVLDDRIRFIKEQSDPKFIKDTLSVHSKEYKSKRLKREGYTIRRFNNINTISARKGKEYYYGTINQVFKKIFGYQ